jgi:hypothetical protein
MMVRKLMLVALALAATGSVFAQTPPGNDREDRHGHGPVAAACEGKAVGTPVTVTFKDGQTRTVECGVHHHHSEQGAAANP